MADPELTLRALPYHEALADYLKSEERETWTWFASAEALASHAEALRVDLLKHTVRLDATAYPVLFDALADAKAKLGVTAPATLYQAQSGNGRNAALYFLPGEVHIVLQGDVLPLLNPEELRGVLGHELAHFILWSGSDRRFLLADRIAQAMANDPRAEPSHVESARLLRLYTEIYADRGALQVTGDPAAVIAGLVKIQTGLAQVDAATYLQQADEIFAHSKVKTDGVSHPEAFIRARAVMLWSENAPQVDAEVCRMIEGDPSLDNLDLIGQQRLTALTRRWLQLFLRPIRFRTDVVRGQVRMYFPEFDFAEGIQDDGLLLAALRGADAGVRDYFCYLLLDFAVVDPELEGELLSAAFLLTTELGWDERFEVLVVKELKVKKREAQRLRAEARAVTGGNDELAETDHGEGSDE